MLRPTRSSAAYRYPLRRTGFWQHYLLDYDAYDTVGSTQKSTLWGTLHKEGAPMWLLYLN